MLNPKIVNQYKNTKTDAASAMTDIRGKNILMGFWHNWPSEPGQGYKQGLFKEMQLTDIPEAYNVVAVAFMKGAGIPTFKPYNLSDDEFRAQVATLNAQGRAVLISLGGADAHIELHAGQEQALVYEIIRLVEIYGFDGLDIDLEQAAITFADNRTVLPAALRLVRKHYEAEGKHFIISMAPEFPYLRAAGSYLAYINALEDLYDFIAPQYYNQGGDGIWVDELNLWVTQNNDTQKKAFLYYLTDSLIHGTRGYASIPADRLVIGLPSNNDGAATGYAVDPQDVKGALQELADAGSPIRGLMTWSVNWDAGKDKHGKEYDWEFVKRYGYLTSGETPVPGKPSIPADLTLSGQTENSVTLIWRLSEGAHPVRIYNLFRDGRPVGTTTAPPFIDTAVSPGAIYDYRISATDIEGNTSDLSQVLKVYMFHEQPPSTPGNFREIEVTSSSVTLAWKASTGPHLIAYYRVFRNRNQEFRVYPPDTHYTDTGLTPNTAISYSIGARDVEGGLSRESEPLHVTTTPEDGNGIEDWKAGVAYALNQEVNHHSFTYKCRQPHTSIPQWAPDIPGSESLWLLLGPAGL
ncbi:fibronectin type III domain-containing protein [Pseudomonas tremae]|uniref:Chitinase n=2 Tax=Pseudomonas syringae group TaxID=136849 RepID=A0AB37QKF1_9PSED|nr:MULTISPECIES: glycosyl hydrolase family 18 protein [Pseudomonas syringae group]RMR97071.1 Chitinase [Pseudomonas coronafaciens pv. garcae]RMS35603.1 Chitinase [Pseudomonas coronafaciens pv. garcae]RMU99719.1 Chitinase [Pseudomonas coronafaciens pv. coronafaciens]